MTQHPAIQELERIQGHAVGVSLDDPIFRMENRAPVLSDTERRAYQAAWRILREPVPAGLEWNALACPGARATREADWVARIIAEEMGR